MKVAVLGAGPSGLMAAWAAMQMGAHVNIFDKQPALAVSRIVERRDESINAGVMLLHNQCNIVSMPSSARALVKYEVMGADFNNSLALMTAYRDKVYGAESGVLSQEVSVLRYLTGDWTGPVQEWDPFAALTAVLDFIRPVEDTLVTGYGNAELKRHLHDHDRVISTVPLTVLLRDEDRAALESQQIWVRSAKAGDPSEAYVWYNPWDNTDWYRTSAVFGRFTQEFSARPNVPVPVDSRLVTKPIRPGASAKMWMDSWEETNKVHFAGRFGTWSKTQELHDVFDGVIGFLS